MYILCKLLPFALVVTLLARTSTAAVQPVTFDGKLEASALALCLLFAPRGHSECSVSADNDDFNTGGSTTVSGVSITIPKNLQFQLPAAFLPFEEVAEGDYIGYEVLVRYPHCQR